MPSPPPKPTAYSTPPTTSDTSFRRTWDRTEYAAKAAARETTEKRDSAARYEARLLGKKYYPPPPLPPASTTSSSSAQHHHPADEQIHQETDTTSRPTRLDVTSLIGKTTLVPLGAAVGKRGKGAGFYCEACDLTFKDNVQFVDHLNSRQHLGATGQSGEVRRAGVGEVRARLEFLARRREEEVERGREGVGLRERLEGRREEMEREREGRRERRREKRRVARGARGGVGKGEGEREVRGGIIC